MSQVRRIFVEKKDGIEAKHFLADIRENLNISGLEGLRLFNRYDISGLDEKQFEIAKRTIFAEPNIDILYDEEFDLPDEYKVFAMEYLPGQYDQRADCAARCVQLLTQGEPPKVQNARVIALKGDLTDSDMQRIINYFINPVDSRLASFEKPLSLDMEIERPEDVKVLDGFINMTDQQVEEYHESLSLAMTREDLFFCRDYFRDKEKRDPTITEIRVIDTYWSDHCRHTTFLTELEDIEIEKGEFYAPIKAALDSYMKARDEVYGESDRPVSLMDIAVMGMKLLRERGKLDDLEISGEINASSIEVPVEIDGKTETWLVQFKNETHNHPTEIEPFGGAATCLGGAIRDPLSGRAYIYQAMRITGAGDPRTPLEDTLEGKLPQRKITTEAARGYSSYGNQIGVAAGQVVELFDPGYVAKRMEAGAVIGASPKSNVIREVPCPGDVIVLLGGRTGRDGCGGATGSSKAHTEESTKQCEAEVQKGNPLIERNIQRLFFDPKVSRMIKRCNDFGAGGVSVAIGELAPGLDIDLDSVPKKYEGLDGTELAISESQERMAVVLDKKDVQSFIEAAHKENLEATPVAVVKEDARLTMKWRGKTIVDISRDFLNTNGVRQKAKVLIKSFDKDKNYRHAVPDELKGKSVAQAFLDNLSRLEVCSQYGIAERFDSTVGAGTVLAPFGGIYQLTPEEAMVAKIPALKGKTDTATAMSYGFIPGLSRWSPFHSAAYAVIESLSKLAAVGANPLKARLSFQEYFERLYGKPERFGKPCAALLGALQAQLELEVPSIGGKDSMSGSFNELDVPPTLISFAVAATTASGTVSAAFKQAGSRVVFVPLPENPESALPDYGKVKEMYKKVHLLSQQGKIKAASVVREGGVAYAVARMCFGNKIGFEFESGLDMSTLYAPLSGSMVLELEKDAVLDIDHVLLGYTTKDKNIVIDGTSFNIDKLIDVWQAPLASIFPVDVDVKPDMSPTIKPFAQRSNLAPSVKVAKPRVFIPVFPGTNCEIETARAFESAGAILEVFVFNNLTGADIERSVKHIAQRIGQSQIIVIPGGFSGGGEPEGGGKFIATVFRNSYIKDAVTELLKVRDGLILGISDGFQALIKLGLLPYGEIRDIKENDPALTLNTLGRHVSRMVNTKVVSVKSPWLALCQLGEIHTVPVSHGEGRFMADRETLEALNRNGQVAFQYVDLEGNPSDSIRYNPSGSTCAIEGITSPDGRVLGKMGHLERTGEGLIINVPGNANQKLFESGVKYFA